MHVHLFILASHDTADERITGAVSLKLKKWPPYLIENG